MRTEIRNPHPLWGSRPAWLTPAVLLVVPAGVLAFMILFESPEAPIYVLSSFSTASTAIVIIASFVSVSAAWESEILQSVWRGFTVTRPWWQILVGRLSIPFFVGLVLLVAVYAAAFFSVVEPVFPGLLIPAVSLMSLVAWTLFGAALGLMVNRIIAIPVAMLAPYLIVGLPSGWSSPLWARHLTGSLGQCCHTDEVVAPAAVIASLATLGALAVVAACVCAARLAPAMSSAAIPLVVALVASAGAFGVVSVSGVTRLGAQPVVARPTDAVVCVDDVCGWPEETRFLPMNRQAWEEVRQAWVAAKLPEPPVEIGPSTDSESSRLHVTLADENLDTIKVSMMTRLPSEMLRCRDNEDLGKHQEMLALSAALLNKLNLPTPEYVGLLSVDIPKDDKEIVALWNSLEPCGR